ncbi:MAG: archaellin/type IV pilin N-terminal domain-containing protein [Candidatus Aenigmatarchaeota archaeon]
MKGISPLLASVLLIAVTVAIATLVMGWMSTTMRSTQTTVSNKTTQATECSAAAISIDDVYLSGLYSANVIVRNSGQTDNLQITSVQLYNVTGGNFTTSTAETDFDKGEVTTFAISVGSNTFPIVDTCPTDFSKVIVTTNCGGIKDTFEGTPKCA